MTNDRTLHRVAPHLCSSAASPDKSTPPTAAEVDKATKNLNNNPRNSDYMTP